MSWPGVGCLIAVKRPPLSPHRAIFPDAFAISYHDTAVQVHHFECMIRLQLVSISRNMCVVQDEQFKFEKITNLDVSHHFFGPTSSNLRTTSAHTENSGY